MTCYRLRHHNVSKKKEMSDALSTIPEDVGSIKSAKRGDAEHLGDAEKAQDDRDKDDPVAVA
jgi:hypothetical protein